MEHVFAANSSDKPKLVALLEADPYAEKSFSRNGYKLKDGAMVGQEKDKVYLYLKCTDDFAKFAKEKLAGLATDASPEAAKAVIAKIHEEESNAEVGFGAIFG